uniref:Nectin cell adhesion molecule 4 n=1 Tax=Pelusios castaneus TaxID=367368 RepID=A0A8C8T1G2_9SAUR
MDPGTGLACSALCGWGRSSLPGGHGLIFPLPVPPGSLAGVLEMESSVTAVLGKDVVLPCRYRAQEGEKVVQVTWLKQGASGQNVEIAVLNLEYGEHVQEPYVDRVGGWCHRAEERCAGRRGRLRMPPHHLPFGQTLAASCTAEGNPVPTVTWETEVHGTNSTRHSSHPRSASVTSEFFLVPGRSMNGKTLTCVVSHPGLQHEKRITHVLSVAYLSDASVRGHEEEEDWHVGKEGASLKCLGEGNPPPTYNWTRLSGPMPKGVKVKGATLLFQRPLTSDDTGVYVCQVANRFAAKEVRASVSIKGRVWENELQKVDVVSASVVAVGVIAAVLLCLLVLVVVLMTLYHRRKTRRISKKYEEELTLTRENSIRRLYSSHGSNTRNQTEETLHLRGDSQQGSLRGDSLRGTSICSAMSEEAEGRSYSTLSTVREIETQTEQLPAPAMEEKEKEMEKEKEEEEEEEERDDENTIKAAMTHFVQENGTLRAKPTTNGIYINGRGHLV